MRTQTEPTGWLAPEQLRQLIDDHAAALELFARQWCESAEDVVQEAFLKLVQQFTPPDNSVAWLYRVVRNGAISASRAAYRRRRHEAAASGEARVWFVPAESNAIDAEVATEALCALPVEQRETIVAHLWGGLSFEEIAELTETSSSTAHRRYVAGLVALRERLEAECPTNRSNNPT